MKETLIEKVLIHLGGHAVLAFLVGILAYWLTQSWKLALFGAGVNILMDVDHVLEYVFWARRFRLREFLAGNYFKEKKTIMVIFHGWEYVALALIYWLASGAWGGLVVAIAMGVHLIFDQLSWDLYPGAYFLIYRLRNKFAIAKICRDYKA